MALVTCPHCGNHFSSAADACARCGLRTSAHKVPSTTPVETATVASASPRRARGFDPNDLSAPQVVGILFALGLAIWLWGSLTSSPSNDTRAAAPVQPPKPEHSKLDAWVMARQFVENSLKSPGTAEFGSPWKGDYQSPDEHVTDLGNGQYIARGWVDAQNSFGAKMRADFVVKLHFAGGDKWVLDEPVSLVQRE